MMGCGMVIGKVVGEIVFTGTPMNYKLALLDSVADPVKSHVNGFGATLFDCLIGDASGACIVGLDGCGSLRMSHFLKCNTERDTVASVLEDGAEFCFGGVCHDVSHDGADGVDGAVIWWRCGGGMVVAARSGGIELREKVSPARLLALALERYEASLWMWRYMSLAVYRTVASRWAAA
jgi:hypothetical protein